MQKSESWTKPNKSVQNKSSNTPDAVLNRLL